MVLGYLLLSTQWYGCRVCVRFKASIAKSVLRFSFLSFSFFSFLSFPLCFRLIVYFLSFCLLLFFSQRHTSRIRLASPPPGKEPGAETDDRDKRTLTSLGPSNHTEADTAVAKVATGQEPSTVSRSSATTAPNSPPMPLRRRRGLNALNWESHSMSDQYSSGAHNE